MALTDILKAKKAVHKELFHAKKAVQYNRLKMSLLYNIVVVRFSCTKFGKCTFFPQNTNVSTARYRLKYCLKGPLNPKQQQQLTFLDLFPRFMPRHKKVARYYFIPSENFSVCPSVCPSVRQRFIIRVRPISLIPFVIISRNLAQI